MTDPRELKRKLDGVDSLRGIVNAMRNLAAVYVRRAEAALAATRPYTEVVETALAAVMERWPPGAGPMPEAPGPDRCLALVFGSDQGLCAAYNDRIVRRAVAFRAAESAPTDFAVVGRRPFDLLERRGIRPVMAAPAPASLEGIHAAASELAADLFEAYTGRGAGRLVFIYNEYRGLGQFGETVRPVLPPRLEVAGSKARPPLGYEPILTAPAADVLAALAEEFFFIQLCRALFESHTSENGARLLSMTAAGASIDQRHVELLKQFQSARQDAITAELLDVVGGAEALNACTRRQ